MQITQINNIYSLVAFIILIIVAVSIIIFLVLFIIRRAGRLNIKKGDIEVSFDNQTEKIVEKIVEVKRKRSLSEHVFFIEMDKWVKYDLNKIKISSESKRIVVTKFLKIKFKTFTRLLKDYITNAEQILNTNSDYKCDDIIELFFRGIDEYNSLARETEIRIGNRIMKGVPEIFIRKFDEWHTPHIEIVVESIKNIINNEIYIDEYIKLIAILEVFYIAFRLTILDAMQTLNDINGELDKEIEEKLCGI